MNELLSFDAVVLCNGCYPTAELPLRILRETPFVVCCDGAADDYIRFERRTPNAIVGDGDSLSEKNKQRFSQLIHHNPCQETNDQTKAIEYLADLGKQKIAILGATGKREDHTLGNISLLIEYYRKGLNVIMITDYGIFIPCKDTHTQICKKGCQVSIFNISAKNFSSCGLRYPLYDFDQWWQGTLNEVSDTSFSIDALGEYILFISYDTK